MPDVISVGDVNMDIFIYAVRVSKPKHEFKVKRLGVFAGGSAANFAVAVSRLGLQSGFIGCLGRDMFGEHLMDEFLKEGVDISHVRFIDDVSTGTIIFLIRGRRRTQFYYYGANACLCPDDLDVQYIGRARLIHLNGYSLIISKSTKETIIEAAEIAKNMRTLVSFDPGSRICLANREVLEKILSLTDIIFPNLEEAEVIAGFSGKPEKIAKKISDLGPKVVALKLGDRGCLIYYDGKFVRKEAFQVNVVDTTGAGDAFAAAFVYGWLRGWNLEKIASFSNAAGALTLTKLGARKASPTVLEIEKFLKKIEPKWFQS